MSALFNIEPVSLFVMLFAVTLGKKCIYPIYIYIAMEFLIFGLNLWSVNYLYIWLILAIAAFLMRDVQHPAAWAVLSGGFGLLFGLFCTPVYLIVEGWRYALAWWINGFLADILHCCGNFFIAFFLFVPLRKHFTRLCRDFCKKS